MAVPAYKAQHVPTPRRREKSSRRLKQAMAFFTLFYGALVAWLIYLQVVRGQFFRTQGVQLRTVTVTYLPKRGDMVDTNMLPISTTAQRPTVMLDREAFTRAMTAPERADRGKAPQPEIVRARVMEAGDAVAAAFDTEVDTVLPLLQNALNGTGTEELFTNLDSGLVDRVVSAGSRAGLVTRFVHAALSADTMRIFRANEDFCRVVSAFTQGDASAIVRNAADSASLPPGIRIENRPVRLQGAGEDAVQLVGLTKFHQGRLLGVSGLERLYNTELSGTEGQITEERTPTGRPIPNTRTRDIRVVNGRTAQLTLDRNIQQAAMGALLECSRKHTPVGATAIVLNAADSSVLAMASVPTFDPTPADMRMERADAQGKDTEGVETAPSQNARAAGSGGFNHELMANRAVRRYEPGSTLKSLTVLTALQEGVVSMSDRFFCSGSLTDRRLGKTIHCVLHGPDERNGHGWQTVREVLRKSCNVATAQIALRLRSNHLYAAIRRAGLVERRLLGLPGEHRGTLAKRDGMDDTSSSTVARVGFGQSIEVTPIAMAAMYAAIANGGVWTAPHLLKAWLNEDGTTQQPAPPARMRIASPTIAAQVRDCLQYVAESPGLKVVQIPGYTVAGKTGTAQKRAYGGKGYAVDKRIASFIGFVPATNPKVVVCVVVDEPHNGRFGAEVAAPVFRKIAEEVMLYLKTPHDATVTQKSLRTASNG